MVKRPGSHRLRTAAATRGLGPSGCVCYQKAMKQGFRSGLAQVALALLVAVALAAAGWAHRLPGTTERAAAEGLSAYLSIGGSASDLCGTLTGSAASKPDCPVCRMPGLAPPPAHAVLPTALCIARVAAALLGETAPAAARHPGWHGRAPPVV